MSKEIQLIKKWEIKFNGRTLCIIENQLNWIINWVENYLLQFIKQKQKTAKIIKNDKKIKPEKNDSIVSVFPFIMKKCSSNFPMILILNLHYIFFIECNLNIK